MGGSTLKGCLECVTSSSSSLAIFKSIPSSKSSSSVDCLVSGVAKQVHVVREYGMKWL